MSLKKIFISAVLSTVIIIPFLNPVFTQAHELIPRELQVYLETHPNATPEEIKAFADEQAPEFAEKFENGEEIISIIRNQNTNPIDNAIDFFKLGVHHILGGLDHILFVLSLLLVFVSWKDILKLTGTFTIAHSITLILAGTGILTLSSQIVEPLIALSIAYVAITTVFFKDRKYLGDGRAKVAMVFFFGLFHGLGFAGLLQEIQIPADKFIASLISFNVGIEIGQIIIVALAFPFIYFLRNKSWYPTLIKIIAVIIGILGIFWAIQRALGF